MVRKVEVVNWSMLIVFYAVTFTVMPLLDYANWLRASGEPLKMQEADQWLGGYFGGFASFFILMLIYKTYLKIYYLRLANRYPRQNMTIITNTGMYFEEGVGLVNYKAVQVSQVKAEEYINDEELKRMYVERAEWLQKFYKSDIDKLNEVNTSKGIMYEIPTINEQEFNFAAYNLDYLKIKDIASFFDKQFIDYLATKSVKTADDYVNLDESTLKEIESEFKKTHQEKLYSVDFKKIQIQMLNSIDYFSKDEVKFFHSKGVHTMQDLSNADLENLSKEFNTQFKQKSISEKIVNACKKALGKEYKEDNIDLETVVRDLKEKIVEKEKHFVYNLSSDARYKHIYLKLVILKAIHYDYHAYIMQFDKNIVINVGKNFKAGESFEKFVKGEDEYEDEENITINKALVILPTSLENAYKYSLGMLNNFHGVPTECEQLTEAEYIFRGMLDSDYGVLLCNNCSYLRDALKIKGLLDPITIQKIERDSMRDILNESITQREGFQKLLQLQQSRVTKKDDEMEMVFAHLIDDLQAVDTARRWTIEKKPVNLFTTLMYIIMLVLGFFIGIAVFNGMSSIVG